ncbi:MAG TPA: potassium-transporting ATPase subunit KdpA [Chthoniobacteraceae bacterium]|nr:potassium-transporting ATPase subunit KdpA [Chthoniobacteraceae bacterium]
MNTADWLQFALFLLLLAAITKPLGLYLVRVLDAQGVTFLDPLLKPLERGTYAAMGIDPRREQGWKGYVGALLLFSFIGGLLTFLILRYQHLLPLNPQRLPGLSPGLAFNTAVSFTTNTDWQSYSGETTLSAFSQMVGLTFHQFVSAAVGIGVAAALVRGIARRSAQTIGNFWVDLIRINYYLLLPLSLILAIVLVSQGMIQNFKPYETVRLVEAGGEAGAQTIAQGPMASQVAIKLLGGNGGGFFNANAAHPYENPTPFSNLLQMLAIFAIGSGLTAYLGQSVGQPRHGWALWSAMMLILVGAVALCWWAEAHGNPVHQQLGIAAADGNMEGKEVRFGIFPSSLFTTVATAGSCGAVNSALDSYTPLGGAVPLLLMQLGEVVIGGAGSGLYGMLMFVLLTVFIAGLMVGRSPEYLRKRIGGFEIKMVMLSLLVLSFSILGFTAAASVSEGALAGLGNAGPHGFGEMLHAYSSASANNGSALAGLSTDTPWYNVTLAVAMLAGRFLTVVPALALAGSLARKSTLAAGPGAFPVGGATFTLLLAGTVLLVGALNFLPALALGPIVEHFLMNHGNLF